MRKYLILYLLFFVTSYFLINNFSITYSFEDYKEYITVLISIASMVFTIMGIWIAFIYPDALNRIVKGKTKTSDFKEILNQTNRVESLVISILLSALVMLVISMIFLTKIILFKTNFYYQNAVVIKEIVLAITLIISLVQIKCVFNVIYSNVLFILDLHNKREQAEGDADI